jgi:hypothetical protein
MIEYTIIVILLIVIALIDHALSQMQVVEQILKLIGLKILLRGSRRTGGQKSKHDNKQNVPIHVSR